MSGGRRATTIEPWPGLEEEAVKGDVWDMAKFDHDITATPELACRLLCPYLAGLYRESEDCMKPRRQGGAAAKGLGPRPRQVPFSAPPLGSAPPAPLLKVCRHHRLPTYPFCRQPGHPILSPQSSAISTRSILAFFVDNYALSIFVLRFLRLWELQGVGWPKHGEGHLARRPRRVYTR